MTQRIEKIAGAVLFALILIVGINLGGDAVNHVVTPSPPVVAEAPSTASTPPTATPAAEAPAAQSAAAAGPEAVAPEPIAPLVAAASTEAGEAAAKVCKACHTFEQGGANRVGPNLYGIVGRDIGSVEGFAYSQALKTLPETWTDERLDGFLLDPKAAAPGTKMAFAGIKKAEDRAALIAYLRSLSPDAPPLE